MSPRVLVQRTLVTGLGTLAAMLALAAPASACPGKDVVPARGAVEEARKATLCLLNAERRAHGLRAVRENRRLRRAAVRHSRAMVRDRFFEHTSPSGSTMAGRVARTGYDWSSLGENIAWGTATLATPAAIVRGWMTSPGHRANVLGSRFREIGIGIAPGVPLALLPGERGATYTTDFGSRR